MVWAEAIRRHKAMQNWVLRPLLSLVLLLLALSCYAGGSTMGVPSSEHFTAISVAQDSVPKPKRQADEQFPASSRAEKSRAAVIVKHTKLGTVPPDSEAARQRQEDKQQEAEAKKAKELAELADRMERRRKRLAELAEDRGDLTKVNRKKLARQERAERKRELQRLRDERDREKALAKQAAEDKEKRARLAKQMAIRDAERKKKEAEQAVILAKREAKRQEALAEQRAKQQAEATRRAKLTAEAEAERARRAAARPPRPTPAVAQKVAPPKLSPEERARREREARELAKQQRIAMAIRQKDAAKQRKIDLRNARIAYKANRGKRLAARRQAKRDAVLARADQRRARRDALASRRADRNKARLARLAKKAEAKADRVALQQERKQAKILARAERNRAREAKKADRLALRNAKRADKIAAQLARKKARDLRRAELLAAREARRSDRLARRAMRRAERMARREARRATRLARREARRLRRLQNPPYWTAEPAVAIGLPMRSGGASDEKALEAVTVQALAGYHRAKGLSVRAGMAATIVNSKISSTQTTSETITQDGVIRIIRNADGTQTEIRGPVQVQQTTTTETRYFNRLTSIDLPLLVGYRLRGNRYGLLLEAGPSLNLSSGGDAHVRAGDTFQAVGGGHFLGRRAGIGFLLQATGEYKLSETGALIGGLRIQSFGGAFEDREVAGSSTKVSTVSLLVGYRIRF